MSGEALGPRGYNSRDPEIAELRAAIARLTRENVSIKEQFKHIGELHAAEHDALAAELAKAREALAQVSDPATVGGMLFEDRDKCLQAIARAALAAAPEKTP